MLFERNMLPYELEYEIIENDINVVELEGAEEKNFIKDIITKALRVPKLSEEVIRIALEDENVIVVEYKEMCGIKTLYLLKDSNKRVYVI